MEFEAILFDLDGVLIESSDTWWHAVNATLEKFGKAPVTKEQFLKIYWGPHLSKTFQKINLGQEAIDYCNEQFYHYLDKIKIFPETKKVLSQAKENYKVALVTNTPRENTLASLKKFSLAKFFDTIIAGDEIQRGKPHPEMLLKACQSLNVKPENSLLIGDTKADIQAGKKAGCFVVGLKISGGDKRIENLGELLKILEV